MTSQITISQPFKDNCEKFPSTTLTYIKNPVLHLFLNLEKLRSPLRATLKKIPKSLFQLGKTWSYSLKPKLETLITNLYTNREVSLLKIRFVIYIKQGCPRFKHGKCEISH